VNTYAVGSFTNIDVGYIDMSKRTQWYAGFSDIRDFIVFLDSSGNSVKEQSNRTTRLRTGLVFPVSTNTRFHTIFGVQARDILSTNFVTFQTDPTDPNIPHQEFGILSTEPKSGTSPFVALSMVHDTTRFKEFGPWHGKRINFTAGITPYSTGD